jgi:hypothetical protein
MRCRLLAQWAPSKLMLLDHFHETCKFDQNLIIFMKIDHTPSFLKVSVNLYVWSSAPCTVVCYRNADFRKCGEHVSAQSLCGSSSLTRLAGLKLDRDAEAGQTKRSETDHPVRGIGLTPGWIIFHALPLLLRP